MDSLVEIVLDRKSPTFRLHASVRDAEADWLEVAPADHTEADYDVSRCVIEVDGMGALTLDADG
jgi:hypothetical protein